MTDTILSVAEVDNEINGAESEVADLEQRVIDGDAKVTPSMISKAREKLDFLGLRRKAAEKAEADAAAAEHAKQVEALKARYEGFVTADRATLQQAYCATVDAISEFWRQLQAWEVERNAIALLERKLGTGRLSEGDRRWIGGKADQYFEWAVQEGKTGLPPARTSATSSSDSDGRHVHQLHTDEHAEGLVDRAQRRRERNRELEAERAAERQRQAEEERRHRQEIDRAQMRREGYEV